VVDCSHALQEKKEQDQTKRVKDRNLKAAEESIARKTGGGSAEDGQEETIEEEEILEG
jgi:transposase